MKYFQSLIIVLSRNWKHIAIIILVFCGYSFNSKYFSCNKTIPEFLKLKSEVIK